MAVHRFRVVVILNYRISAGNNIASDCLFHQRFGVGGWLFGSGRMEGRQSPLIPTGAEDEAVVFDCPAVFLFVEVAGGVQVNVFDPRAFVGSRGEVRAVVIVSDVGKLA